LKVPRPAVVPDALLRRGRISAPRRWRPPIPRIRSRRIGQESVKPAVPNADPRGRARLAHRMRQKPGPTSNHPHSHLRPNLRGTLTAAMDGFGIFARVRDGPCYRVRRNEKFLSDRAFGLNIRAETQVTRVLADMFHGSSQSDVRGSSTTSRATPPSSGPSRAPMALPDDPAWQIDAFVQHQSHARYHGSIQNLTPADIYFGGAENARPIAARPSLRRVSVPTCRLHS